MANKPPKVKIQFEEGDATFEDTVSLYTEIVKAISTWDFTPPEKRKEAMAS